jgi:amino acid transporter
MRDVDSRMVYAFARDRGVPFFSAPLKKVSPKWKTPVAAIWTTAVLSVASTLYAPAYSTLTTACIIFLYVSYVMPTGLTIACATIMRSSRPRFGTWVM